MPSNRLPLICLAKLYSDAEISFVDFFKGFIEPVEWACHLMGQEDRPPGDEEEEKQKLRQQTFVGVVENLFEYLSLALTELFGLFEERNGRPLLRVSCLAGLFILGETGSRQKVVAQPFVGEGIKHASPNPNIEAKHHDDGNDEQGKSYISHKAELQRLVDQKVLSAIGCHEG